jgi:hypothetical protein
MYVCNILSKVDSYSEDLYLTPRPQSAGPSFVGCSCIFILTVTSHIWSNNSTLLPNIPQLSNSLLPLANICITHISSLSLHHSIQLSHLWLWRLWKHIVDVYHPLWCRQQNSLNASTLLPDYTVAQPRRWQTLHSIQVFFLLLPRYKQGMWRVWRREGAN